MVIAGVGVCHRWKHLTDPTYDVLDVKRAPMLLALTARVAKKIKGSVLDVLAEPAVACIKLAVACIKPAKP